MDGNAVEVIWRGRVGQFLTDAGKDLFVRPKTGRIKCRVRFINDAVVFAVQPERGLVVVGVVRIISGTSIFVYPACDMVPVALPMPLR